MTNETMPEMTATDLDKRVQEHFKIWLDAEARLFGPTLDAILKQVKELE